MPANEETYDAIIVGGGFGGVYHLVHLREVGLRCRLIEAASDLGGTWFWNTYPGARSDSDIPIYEFSRPDLWKGWTWTERFPGWNEIQAYFAYVDDKFDLRKDCKFDSPVKQAHWDDDLHIWHIVSDGKDGVFKAAARHLIMCTGFTSNPSIPKFNGLETYQGVWSHTARWPKQGIELSGKRVGVIGTGASGIQVIQDIGRHVDHLTVFQRTPNLAIPMDQYQVSKQVQDHFKQVYEEIHTKLHTTFGALPVKWIPRPMAQVGDEEREATFEELWKGGGFHFLLGNYQDLLHDKDTNDATYSFWRKKVGEKIRDPKKRELLAPAVQPHPFGCRRPCLEQYVYEIFDQDNVEIVDLNANSILEITSKGVKTTEAEHEVDVLILATGFESADRAFLDIDLRGLNGLTIQDHWRNGTISYLATTIDNFPNLFFVHGPQRPPICNAPTCVEIQGSWIVKTIEYLRKHGMTKFSPTSNAALAYRQHVEALLDATVCRQVKKPSRHAADMPGKKRDVGYLGGIPLYERELMEEMKNGYPGFRMEALRTVCM